MHAALMALTSYEPNDLVANSRKNPSEAWRKLQKRHDPTTGGRTRNLLRTIISPGRCSLLELQAVIERWESYVSRYEKKLKDKLDDEIKLAGLGALVPEELEKHLMLNSNRLRTFEDARLEARIGSMIRDSKPSDTGSRGHSGPMDVDAVNSLSHLAKEKGPRVRVMGVSSKETAMHARARASNRLARANRASHGPRVKVKDTIKKTVGNPKESPKEPKVRTKVPKAHTRVKHRKLVSQVWKKTKSGTSSETQESAQTCPTDNSWIQDAWSPDEWNDGWSYDEWNDDWSSVGWHEGWNKRMAIPQAHFHLEVLILVRDGLNG